MSGIMRLVGVASLALIVAGCGPSGEAKKAVSREMRDPSSVQFRDVKSVKQADGSTAVCGEYNAKNAYGAYVGFEGFSYHSGRVYLQKSNPDMTDAGEIAQATEGLEAHTRLCVLKGQTIEEVQAETKRILESVEAMKRGSS